NSSAYTAGSVIFSDGTKLTQDNTNFFWDDTNNRLGIGLNNPGSKLDVYSLSTITSGQIAGFSTYNEANPSGASSGSYFNYIASGVTTGNAQNFTNALYGLSTEV